MKYTFILIILLSVVGISQVRGHSLGSSLEKEVDGYLIDIGYEPPSFVVGEQAVFDLNLMKDSLPVDFDHVWLRITEHEETMLATGVRRSDLGITSVVYVFPNSGEYTLSASFRGDDGVIAETTFPIIVSSDAGKGVIPHSLLLVGLAGGVLGFVAGMWLRKSR